MPTEFELTQLPIEPWFELADIATAVQIAREIAEAIQKTGNDGPKKKYADQLVIILQAITRLKNINTSVNQQKSLFLMGEEGPIKGLISVDENANLRFSPELDDQAIEALLNNIASATAKIRSISHHEFTDESNKAKHFDSLIHRSRILTDEMSLKHFQKKAHAREDYYENSNQNVSMPAIGIEATKVGDWFDKNNLTLLEANIEKINRYADKFNDTGVLPTVNPDNSKDIYTNIMESYQSPIVPPKAGRNRVDDALNKLSAHITTLKNINNAIREAGAFEVNKKEMGASKFKLVSHPYLTDDFIAKIDADMQMSIGTLEKYIPETKDPALAALVNSLKEHSKPRLENFKKFRHLENELSRQEAVVDITGIKLIPSSVLANAWKALDIKEPPKPSVNRLSSEQKAALKPASKTLLNSDLEDFTLDSSSMESSLPDGAPLFLSDYHKMNLADPKSYSNNDELSDSISEYEPSSDVDYEDDYESDYESDNDVNDRDSDNEHEQKQEDKQTPQDKLAAMMRNHFDAEQNQFTTNRIETKTPPTPEESETPVAPMPPQFLHSAPTPATPPAQPSQPVPTASQSTVAKPTTPVPSQFLRSGQTPSKPPAQPNQPTSTASQSTIAKPTTPVPSQFLRSGQTPSTPPAQPNQPVPTASQSTVAKPTTPVPSQFLRSGQTLSTPPAQPRQSTSQASPSTLAKPTMPSPNTQENTQQSTISTLTTAQNTILNSSRDSGFLSANNIAKIRASAEPAGWSLGDIETANNERILTISKAESQFSVSATEFKTSDVEVETFKTMLACFKNSTNKNPVITTETQALKDKWITACKEIYAEKNLDFDKLITIKPTLSSTSEEQPAPPSPRPR